MNRSTSRIERRSGALLIACALLAGCAQLSEQECRTTDWYQRGEVDGLIYGVRPRIDQYAYQCERFGVQPDEKRYLAAGSTETASPRPACPAARVRSERR